MRRPCFAKCWAVNIVFCGMLSRSQQWPLAIYLSLVTMVILSLQSYVTLAYPYRYQSTVTMRRLRITVICSWIFILVTTFSVKFNSTRNIPRSLHNILDDYNRDSYLDLDIPTRSSTSKSNSMDTNSFNSWNCIEKEDSQVNSYCFNSHFESPVLLSLWFVLYFLENMLGELIVIRTHFCLQP